MFSIGEGYSSGGGLAIDSRGVTYAAFGEDSWLYAINPDGSLRWKFDTGHPIRHGMAIGPGRVIYTPQGQAIGDASRGGR